MYFNPSTSRSSLNPTSKCLRSVWRLLFSSTVDTLHARITKVPVSYISLLCTFLMADSIVILRTDRIKDAPPCSWLKGSDLTPAIAAELWRPPMKFVRLWSNSARLFSQVRLIDVCKLLFKSMVIKRQCDIMTILALFPPLSSGFPIFVSFLHLYWKQMFCCLF